MSLEGKNCIVTGGAGALGATVVKTLTAAGARVMALDHAAIPAGQHGIGGIDLSDPAKAVAAIDKAAAEMGGLYAIVNIAGGFRWETLADGKVDTWDFLYNINLKTAVCASKAALPHLLKNKSGRIVNIGAGAAAKPAAAGMGAYTASKAGVAKLTESLAEETKAQGITVNAILPSTIDTAANRKDMPGADFSKWVKAEEIGDLIAFLLSDKASAITGASIPINGRV
ncbi:MAG TPA: SDR family NAD(P)-dependent oxidoreductase [Rhizomicrobium sp.]|nr:SDR family NAD(P)-dependent oxidoreductase [Rhizomicrobium sp.]